ncbi:hypothetical protein [Cellulophaga tyrosinoxydans]|uniref:Tetratricopeptide repeat-containing protein n=1 Tax=Cellulophaga tyrosinoxydans TaxID=504486 RepID=A0A1W2AY84_9FLAO|nr:hypothetical protein [Cellulophaga tyrosinoxydans]SMC65138.1 hypothetical protein SAMN05660703_2281 [Cellulophaga tyrosinoxydans]
MFKKLFFLALFSAVFANAQLQYKPTDKTTLDGWIAEAKEHNEIDISQLQKLDAEYNDVVVNPDDPNRVFDYGRILTAVLQPGLATATEKELSDAGKKIAAESEEAYRDAIRDCDCHGRANIMLGLLYNQQGKYFLSEPYLEKGLELPEGGEDWMVAANQYLLTGAYTYNTTEEKYQKIYVLFKKFAQSVTKDADYYQKMAGLYVSYYEK